MNRAVPQCLAIAAAILLAFPGGAAAATPQDAAAPPRLERVDFRDLPLTEACRLLSRETGLNIVPSEEAGRRRVSLFLRDVSVPEAIEALCGAHQLWHQKDAVSGIVRVRTVQEYRLDLGSYQDETTEIFTLLYPNALDLGRAVRDLFGSRVTLNFSNTDDEVIDDLESRLERFDVFDSRTQGFGTGLLGGSGGAGGNAGFGNGVSGRSGRYGAFGGDDDVGIGYGRRSERRDRSRYEYGDDENRQAPVPQPAASARPGGEMPAEEILRIERLLAEGGDGASNRSVLLEALARWRQAPIHVTVLRRHNKVAVRTADVRAMEQVRDLVGRLDTPTPLVLLEVRVLSVELGNGFTSFFEYQFAKDRTAGAFTTGTIRNPVPPSLDLGGTGLRAGDLTFQFVNANFAARMQLLETKNRVRVLASPLLLTANNEVSRLFVGREVPLNRSFAGGQVVTNESTVTTTPGSTNIEFRPVGTTLFMTPSINADRTVTLRIVQESSDVNSTATVLIPQGTGFVAADLSVVSSQTVSGTIVAKSEMAVAFGGLVEEGMDKQEEQVPLLGDIPLLGYLFKRIVDKATRREIVIMVRPYVLSTPAESEALSRRVLEGLGVDVKDLGLRGGKEKPPREGDPAIPFRLHGVDGEDR